MAYPHRFFLTSQHFSSLWNSSFFWLHHCCCDSIPSLEMPSSFSKPASDPSSSPPRNSPLAQDSSEAERRLREAEERLREAMAELQRRQRSAARGSHGELCDHADVSCVANAIGNLCQSFLLSYGVRVGIGILLRAFKLARGQSYSSLLDLKVSNRGKNIVFFCFFGGNFIVSVDNYGLWWRLEESYESAWAFHLIRFFWN